MIISPSRWVTTTTAAQLCCSALLLKVSNTVSRFHFIWQDETISIKGKVHEWYTIRLRYHHSFGISEIWTSSDRLVIRVWYFFSKIWISYFRSEIGTYITDLRYFLWHKSEIMWVRYHRFAIWLIYLGSEIWISYHRFEIRVFLSQIRDTSVKITDPRENCFIRISEVWMLYHSTPGVMPQI